MFIGTEKRAAGVVNPYFPGENTGSKDSSVLLRIMWLVRGRASCHIS